MFSTCASGLNSGSPLVKYSDKDINYLEVIHTFCFTFFVVGLTVDELTLITPNPKETGLLKYEFEYSERMICLNQVSGSCEPARFCTTEESWGLLELLVNCIA